MGECSDCNGTDCREEEYLSNQGRSKPQGFFEKTHELNRVRKVIGIVSGKGGVGKSLVTSMLAVLAHRKGFEVGILDADITGPTIPKMFGLCKKVQASDAGIFPESTKNGIKVMSINLLIDGEDTPVIWRGPMLAGAVKQFWTDVIWGNLDIMFIDMPPGTGDVPLTVFQSIPLDGIVVVTSPQELVSMIVKKAYNMARQMKIPILGVVENMSFIKCPDCGKEIKLYGESRLSQISQELNLKILGRLPIDYEMAQLADKGEFENFKNGYMNEAVEVIEGLILQR